LPELKKDEILQDVQNFLSEDEKIWYANRGKSAADEKDCVS
jgi:hypothetical protein